MKSDRNSCVKGKKREVEFKPWLLPHFDAGQCEVGVKVGLLVLGSYRKYWTQLPLIRQWNHLHLTINSDEAYWQLNHPYISVNRNGILKLHTSSVYCNLNISRWDS